MRRVPRRALAPLALMLLTAGCTTFSDNDAVARVGNVELSRAELDDQLAELGLEATDEAVPGSSARAAISGWIEAQAVAQGLFDEEAVTSVDPEAIAARYDLGLDAAGITCPAFILTESIELAEEAATRLDDGEDFDAVFAELNIDPGLAETTGQLGCVENRELPPDATAPLDVALLTISAETPTQTAEIVDPAGNTVAVVVSFRGYETLGDQDRARAGTSITSRLVVEDIDIHVDPRYGRFDPASGTVVDLD